MAFVKTMYKLLIKQDTFNRKSCCLHIFRTMILIFKNCMVIHCCARVCPKIKNCTKERQKIHASIKKSSQSVFVLYDAIS